MKYLLFILILNCSICFSQIEIDSVKYINTDASFYTNTLSTHPFGIFISRINHNFQIKPINKVSIAINISSGNVWLPYVKAYIPLYESDKEAMRQLIWHQREGNFDVVQTPSINRELYADGIIRLYQIKFNIPLPGNNELKLSSRMFSLDPGNLPYSSLTSDRLIEWFHSNISGGEDPFARKAYGFNHAGIRYTDENGKTFEVGKGDFLFTGIDLSYYYYPNSKFLEKNNFYTNFGLQLGINVSTINPSMDIGFNPSIIKKINLNERNEIRVGASLGVLRQKLLQFGESVQLSNKKYLLSSEFLLDYVLKFKNMSYISIASTYYIQDSYNKKIDYQYIVLSGDRISTHWSYAISHLYRAITANSLIITYAKGIFALSVYLREDILCDNAPDIQTGIGLQMSFK